MNLEIKEMSSLFSASNTMIGNNFKKFLHQYELPILESLNVYSMLLLISHELIEKNVKNSFFELTNPSIDNKKLANLAKLSIKVKELNEYHPFCEDFNHISFEKINKLNNNENYNESFLGEVLKSICYKLLSKFTDFNSFLKLASVFLLNYSKNIILPTLINFNVKSGIESYNFIFNWEIK